EHHIYSVWDFMSLLKSLQSNILGANVPWIPQKNSNQLRFLREILLEEETDLLPNSENTYLSHFELYKLAMDEVGASTDSIDSFLHTLGNSNLNTALQLNHIPRASKIFTERTFDFIKGNDLHVVASAFAIGREQIIPLMFQNILDETDYLDQAPLMKYYLKRHVQCDEEFHGPMSLLLLNEVCANDKVKYMEAYAAAELAIDARILFWDQVLEMILMNNSTSQLSLNMNKSI
ncbi:DUF3050 domain-containing protein, partial [bacterium]|nr:DUF3050 domain-containing protein [bacterium]